MLRIVVLISGRGSNMEALIRARAAGDLPADIVAVISNRADAAGLATAAASGIATAVVPHGAFSDRAAFDAELARAIDAFRPGLVVLAGFMRILTPAFVTHYAGRLMNIHPSLLPSFPGASAYRQAYDKGVKIVGVTAHFVTPDLDQGPILCQDALRLRADEPLESIILRGQKLESACLLRALKLCLSRQLDVHWGRVHGV